ncbi:MAG: Na/Pi cotransporter [Bacteroidetes bacterium HGW-Bacteroidetes-12]|nr:MAG: Na/Pi cotransporter [Bacteroidetes bacterium HGW-Bacteroidetes-12]
MDFTFIDTLRIIGALGLFIYGIKIMSESIQKSFGPALKMLFNVMTKNKFSGIIAGFIITSLIFSSSSATVMAVSFVNTGLITLAESVSIMLGANVGATVISWLVSIFGFNADFSFIYLMIFAIGTPLIFSSKNKLKYIGEFIFGVALLFLGLSEIISTMPNLNDSNYLFSFYESTSSLGFFNNIFFILVGVLLTIILQSSSASIVFTQVLCFNGIIPFEVAIPMVLGQNFGRTINTEIASITGNVFAKRSARIHSLVNIFGLVWMLIFLSVFPVLSGLDYIMLEVFHLDSVFQSNSAPIGIALFHSLYNIINIGVMVWFIPQLVNLATNTIKSKGDSDEEFRLEHISTGIMATPEMSIIEAQKEIAKFGKLINKMNELIKTLLTEQDAEKVDTIIHKIKKYENITDKIEQDVADYLTKISQGEMSENSSIQIRGMLSIIGDLERIGDIYYQISKVLERKFEEKIWFTPEQRKNILDMLVILDEALTIMQKNLTSNYADVTKKHAVDIEQTLNSFRKKIRKEHYKNVEQGAYSFQNAAIYSDLFNSIEKVGDHVINVTEGVVGEI